MIICGWCGKHTANADRCTSCGHVDPARPWNQRGETAPHVRVDQPGRPTLNPKLVRRRLEETRAALGPEATAEQMAEALDVSVRTLGRWQKLTT